MALPAQQVISSPFLAGTPTAPTPPAGDSSALVPNTSFLQSAIAAAINGQSPKVSQGTGLGQLPNQVKIGWSGTQLLATVDSSNLGNFLFGVDFTNLQNQITAANNRPYAFTGIGQPVTFASVATSGNINVTGTIVCNQDIIAFASDKRLKENIRPIKDALNKLHQITGILFNFNEEANKLGGYDTSRTHMGVFAQDAEKVAPETVHIASFDRHPVTQESISGENYKTVQYDKLVALVIEAVKELDGKVDALDARIDSIVGGQ